MKLDYLKNYIYTFLSTYIIIVIGKFIFLFYLKDNFIEFSNYELSYAIFWGYRFDFAASAIIAFLASWFDFNKKLFSFITALFITSVFLTQISDILYFSESSRHIGYEITDTITDAKSLFMTAYSQHTLITISSLIFAVVLFFIILNLFSKKETTRFDKFYLPKRIFLILLTVFFIRGMAQSIPLNPWQANQIGEAKLATLSLNSIYNIVYAVANKKKKLKPANIPNIDEETISTSFKDMYKDVNIKSSLPVIKTKPNIVFLFQESWNAKHMKSYGFEKNTTPQFDELLKNSIRPTAMIANGHRTTEGIFATLTSFQNPLGKSVAKTQLQSFKYSSIIDILTKDNYSSAFFQGSSKETSGTGSFANNLGFEYSYGKKDIKKRIYEENYWGVQDPDLFNFATKIVDDTLKEPFVIGINGATTHDDKVPNEIKKLNFVENEKLNNQLNALHFSDSALGKFVNDFEKKYPNTIFVIFSDHCGGNISGTFENYLIPFAIYSKKLIKPKYYDTYLSQRDIAPTIFDLTIGSYKTKIPSFSGKSLLSDDEFFTDYFHNGILGWIENNNILEINTATNTNKCFVINDFTKEKVECTDAYLQMKNRALSFTNVSQNLLFKGETTNFKEYRNLNEK